MDYFNLGFFEGNKSPVTNQESCFSHGPSKYGDINRKPYETMVFPYEISGFPVKIFPETNPVNKTQSGPLDLVYKSNVTMVYGT